MLASSYQWGLWTLAGVCWIGTGTISLAGLVLALPLLQFDKTFAFGRSVANLSIWSGWFAVSLNVACYLSLGFENGMATIDAKEMLWSILLTAAIPAAAFGLRRWRQKRPSGK